MSNISVPAAMLEKVAQFVELANTEIADLTSQLEETKKVASEAETKTEVKEVNKVPSNVAKIAAEALVEHGLLSAEYKDKKASELENPEALSQTLAKVASLYAHKAATPALGSGDKASVQKTASTKEDRLAEAKKRFAKNIGL